MLYQVPSGSKSAGWTTAVGCVFWYALRLAINVGAPPAPMRTIALSRLATPCEHPAPAINAYRRPSTNATSATPLTSEPRFGLVVLVGRLVVTVVRWPVESMREIRPPVLLPV
jgi:hypothetical protein